MCSTWLPTVFGEITSCCADLAVREPAREQPQHLDLAGGQALGALAAARDAVAGRAEHGLDRVGVEAAGAHVGAQLGRPPAAGACGGRYGRGSHIAW